MCECEAGFGGPLCEYDMTCQTRLLPINGSGGSGWGSSGCSTASGDGMRVECTCSRTGLVAVLARRIIPETGVNLAHGASASGGFTSMRPLFYPLTAALVYVVAALLAARSDVHGKLYCTRPPSWLQQGHAGWTPAKQVLITARLYLSLLRWRYVMPG